jgi:hypothetical protein
VYGLKVDYKRYKFQELSKVAQDKNGQESSFPVTVTAHTPVVVVVTIVFCGDVMIITRVTQHACPWTVLSVYQVDPFCSPQRPFFGQKSVQFLLKSLGAAG